SLAPGNSPGILTASAVNFDNTPVTSAAPTLQIELGGTTAGIEYDQLHVTGHLSVGGNLNVVFYNGFKPAAGNLFHILDSSSLSGTFNGGVPLPTMNGRIVWDSSHLYTTGALSVGATYYAGDINRDSRVDVADVSAMMSALTNLSSYQATHG